MSYRTKVSKSTPSPWRPRPIPRSRALDPRCRAQYEALDAQWSELQDRFPPAALRLLRERLLRFEGGGPCLRGRGRALPWAGFEAPDGQLEEALYGEIERHRSRLAAAIEVGASAPRFERSTLLEMHGVLLPGHPESGQLRRGKIALAGHFVAPSPDRLAGPVAELCRHLESRSGSPLLRAALAHAQLVNLHPFVDANGRLARALVRVTLERARPGSGALPVWTAMAFTPSPFSAANAAYRAGQPLPWLALFYRAARRATLLLTELLPLAEELELADGCSASAELLLEACSTQLMGDRARSSAQRASSPRALEPSPRL